MQLTSGRTQGPITRLMSPGDLGELVKPFVFLDYFETASFGGPRFADHPHSGIATHTTLLQGSVDYRDSTGKSGRLPPRDARAHALKNCLQVIRAVNALVERDLPATHRERLARARAAGRRMLSLLEEDVSFERGAVRIAGPGLCAEELARVGTPFCTRREGGWGLGLALARTVFARHGGLMQIESAPGAGTLVSIWLPKDTGERETRLERGAFGDRAQIAIGLGPLRRSPAGARRQRRGSRRSRCA